MKYEPTIGSSATFQLPTRSCWLLYWTGQLQDVPVIAEGSVGQDDIQMSLLAGLRRGDTGQMPLIVTFNALQLGGSF